MNFSSFDFDDSETQDRLFDLELRIAQRADQLMDHTQSDHDRDREFWKQAESQVIGIAPPPDAN